MAISRGHTRGSRTHNSRRKDKEFSIFSELRRIAMSTKRADKLAKGGK